MNDTNREAEIRGRDQALDLMNTVAFLGGIASQAEASAPYRQMAEDFAEAVSVAYKDRRYLLSALEREREARQELEKALAASIENTDRAFNAGGDVRGRLTSDGSASLDYIFDLQDEFRALLIPENAGKEG